MTDDAARGRDFPPMHPVTRLGRVIQQLRSFGDLHAGELELIAAQLEAAGSGEVARRVRVLRDVQHDEGELVITELADLQASLSASEARPAAESVAGSSVHDAAANSPRRAQWLAQQAADEERRRQPFPRRDLLGGAAARDDE